MNLLLCIIKKIILKILMHVNCLFYSVKMYIEDKDFCGSSRIMKLRPTMKIKDLKEMVSLALLLIMYQYCSPAFCKC